jgi:hypothetical protein
VSVRVRRLCSSSDRWEQRGVGPRLPAAGAAEARACPGDRAAPGRDGRPRPAPAVPHAVAAAARPGQRAPDGGCANQPHWPRRARASGGRHGGPGRRLGARQRAGTQRAAACARGPQCADVKRARRGAHWQSCRSTRRRLAGA